MKKLRWILILSLVILVVSGASLPAQERASGGPQKENEGPRRILWVWLHNLERHWKDFIDFAADWKCTGVVIWGLDGWKEKSPDSKQLSVDEAFCREVVAYAHARGVQVIHGFGLNGYNEGRYICKQVPAARAVIPDRLKDTSRGKDSVGNIYCPSNPEALKLLRQMLLRAADTGIDGFNFETADVDYITCHCPTCETRFQSANETEGTKPPRWAIEQVNWAVNLLQVERPKLWLSIELAMQSFGQPPYLDSEPIEQLNKEIDPRATLVWCEGTYPPQPICEKLAAGRDNIGFLIRSAEFKGWEGAKKIKPDDIIDTVGRLWTLHPKCFIYRSWWPRERWVVNMAVAAEAMRDPNQPNARFVQIEAEMERLSAPGQKYSLIENFVPGNLASPAVERTVTCSSEDPRFALLRLTDGVASPSSDMWATERNNPKEAWVEVRWPKPYRIGRVRLYHQINAQYRSLDYTIEYWDNGNWSPVEGMPIKDNKVQGWREHEFTPVTTDRLRVFITRSASGNRMGLGELEVYEAK